MGKIFRYILLSFLLFSPIFAWAYIKPLRVLAPELLGLTCIDKFICTDDLSRIDEAKTLYKDAIKFLNLELGEIENIPQAVFCSSKECSSKFGLYHGSYGHAGAYNVGTVGFVISYRGWNSYYVKHELVHHLQNEKLGSFNAWFFKPLWFKEGMAYSVSKDPRKPLPMILEGYRKKYDLWSSKLSTSQIWKEADKL